MDAMNPISSNSLSIDTSNMKTQPLSYVGDAYGYSAPNGYYGQTVATTDMYGGSYYPTTGTTYTGGYPYYPTYPGTTYTGGYPYYPTTGTTYTGGYPYYPTYPGTTTTTAGSMSWSDILQAAAKSGVFGGVLNGTSRSVESVIVSIVGGIMRYFGFGAGASNVGQPSYVYPAGGYGYGVPYNTYSA